MSQVRVPFNSLLALLQQLVTEKTTWEAVKQRFMVVTPAAEEGEEDSSATAPAAAAGASSTTAATVAPTVVQYSTRGSFSRPNPACK